MVFEMDILSLNFGKTHSNADVISELLVVKLRYFWFSGLGTLNKKNQTSALRAEGVSHCQRWTRILSFKRPWGECASC